MKLGTLSTRPNCYSSRRLREAALDRGHTCKVLNTLKFSIDVAAGNPAIYYRQKSLSDYDAVLPRIGASITYFGTAVLRQFEQMDIFCANTAAGVTNSRDKLRCLQILSRHQLGIPETTFVRDKKDVLPAIERVGGAPVIIKLFEGTQGIGVLLAETQQSAEAIIDYIGAQVDFPEIDIRQRLTVSRGYGVTEIHIPDGSKYIGQQINALGFEDRDINALTLYRDGKVIPNPRSNRELEPEDQLLCFGKLESLRELVPKKTRRNRRPVLKKLPPDSQNESQSL
jgi:Trk K+ transport system NAD-binding subunit